jgi:putative Mn2+ efflux pump MntP
MSLLPLLFFILPLGLDTLGVSISIGIQSQGDKMNIQVGKGLQFSTRLSSAILFSMSETLMPLFGLVIGYAASLYISNNVHVIGPSILIVIGLWELQAEIKEYYCKQKSRHITSHDNSSNQEQFHWMRQLLLAFTIGVDELAIGFSLGAITVRHIGGLSVHPVVLCILIGIQGFLMTVIGISLGRMLRTQVRSLKEWTEFLSAFLLIGLGIWLLVV